jgi:hypothetical protein
MAPEDLVVGRVYRRRELHLAGLGGNWQSGISYPADGTYVLLFSDPDARQEHGYAVTWCGAVIERPRAPAGSSSSDAP